ncbi:hypothetical protein TSUD_130130 [Trifolium subterraneum]|nr:hypothetical protein TSUD_130130 [Trifolium subterraneum]
MVAKDFQKMTRRLRRVHNVQEIQKVKKKKASTQIQEESDPNTTDFLFLLSLNGSLLLDKVQKKERKKNNV